MLGSKLTRCAQAGFETVLGVVGVIPRDAQLDLVARGAEWLATCAARLPFVGPFVEPFVGSPPPVDPDTAQLRESVQALAGTLERMDAEARARLAASDARWEARLKDAERTVSAHDVRLRAAEETATRERARAEAALAECDRLAETNRALMHERDAAVVERAELAAAFAAERRRGEAADDAAQIEIATLTERLLALEAAVADEQAAHAQALQSTHRTADRGDLELAAARDAAQRTADALAILSAAHEGALLERDALVAQCDALDRERAELADQVRALEAAAATRIAELETAHETEMERRQTAFETRLAGLATDDALVAERARHADSRAHGGRLETELAGLQTRVGELERLNADERAARAHAIDEFRRTLTAREDALRAGRARTEELEQALRTVLAERDRIATAAKVARERDAAQVAQLTSEIARLTTEIERYATHDGGRERDTVDPFRTRLEAMQAQFADERARLEATLAARGDVVAALERQLALERAAHETALADAYADVAHREESLGHRWRERPAAPGEAPQPPRPSGTGAGTVAGAIARLTSGERRTPSDSDPDAE